MPRSPKTSDYPPIGVVSRFPRTVDEVDGGPARKAAVIAAGTVGDVMARWPSMYGYDGVGPRGGTFTTSALATPTWRLRGIRWVRGVPVDGSFDTNLATGVSQARITLDAAGLPPSSLRIHWNSRRPLRAAVVTGTVGGARVRLRVPAP